MEKTVLLREDGRIGDDMALEWPEIGYDDIKDIDNTQRSINKNLHNTSKLAIYERASEQDLDLILRDLDELLESLSIETKSKELASMPTSAMEVRDANMTNNVLDQSAVKKPLRNIALAAFFAGILSTAVVMSICARQWFIVIPIVSALVAETMYLKTKL